MRLTALRGPPAWRQRPLPRRLWLVGNRRWLQHRDVPSQGQSSRGRWHHTVAHMPPWFSPPRQRPQRRYNELDPLRLIALILVVRLCQRWVKVRWDVPRVRIPLTAATGSGARRTGAAPGVLLWRSRGTGWGCLPEVSFGKAGFDCKRKNASWTSDPTATGLHLPSCCWCDGVMVCGSRHIEGTVA